MFGLKGIMRKTVLFQGLLFTFLFFGVNAQDRVIPPEKPNI
jgi:hypothetical protein